MRQEFQATDQLESLPSQSGTTWSHTPSLTGAHPTAARTAAQAYLAHFAPLLYALQSEDPAEVRQALDTIVGLRAQGGRTLADLEAVAEARDSELVTTLRSAVTQSQALENQLRRRLSHLEPGAPDGQADLQALRQGLARVAAQDELNEVVTLPGAGERRLELEASAPNLGAGLFSGLFALGWLSFTTFHATLMIGGMMKVFGWGALLLLGFYAIFYGVGLAMAAAALEGLSRETVTFEGNEAVVQKKLGGWTREKRYILSPGSQAGITMANFRAKGQIATEIVLNDAEGKTFRFGRSWPEHLKARQLERINSYLRRLALENPGSGA